MYITAQVSLYPLETVDPDHVINQSLETALEGTDLEYEVGPVATEITGTPEDVWRALRRLYEEATIRAGEVGMSINLSNGRP